jgi:hypothetical protein
MNSERMAKTRSSESYQGWNGLRCRTQEEVAEYICRFLTIDEFSQCWVWNGTVGSKGYGICNINRKTILAHRFVYEYCRGPIHDELTIDHVKAWGCVHKNCLNPNHMELVTRGENVMRGNGVCAQNARKTHCKHGHLLSGDNLIMRLGGGRDCRECVNAKARRYQQRRKMNHDQKNSC